MDLAQITTELQYRGFDQDRVDATLKCLVHVYAVQDFTSSETGGMLVDDVVLTYPSETVQAASDLFLEKLKVGGLQAFRVKWGCEEAAKALERQLWELASLRWQEFIGATHPRYLGFFIPEPDGKERVITTWKIRKDLKWFSVAVPQHGWNVLRLIDDITEIAWKLDLAFGFRPFGPDGIQGTRVLLQSDAFAALRERGIRPPESLLTDIRLWRFFSEYDVEATDFVALMTECGLTLDQVIGQVKRFFAKGLTTQYRDGQYPPYFVNEKKKKEFKAEVRSLLNPMESWLATGSPVPEATLPSKVRAGGAEESLSDAGRGARNVLLFQGTGRGSQP